MTSQMIKYFQVLCESLNFTKAAERLYISQSSLSKQLKNLENELDCQLIDRNKTPITLTPAGVLFRNYCNQVSQMHQDLLTELRPYRRCPEQVLRIAAIPMVIDYGAVRCITSFQAQNTGLEIEYSEGSQSAAMQALEANLADVAIVRTDMLDLALYDFIPIAEENLVCVCNMSSPLAKKSSVCLQELQPLPFVTYDSSSALYAYLLEVFRQADLVPPRILHTSSRVGIVLGTISENTVGAVSLLPEELAQNFRSRFPIAIVPLSQPLRTCTAFVRKATSDPEHSTVNTFWEHIHQDFC